jgi:hypothetical protein
MCSSTTTILSLLSSSASSFPTSLLTISQFAWDVGGLPVGGSVAVALAAYYLWRDPAVASHRACLAMQRPSARFVRRSWAILNAPPLVVSSYNSNNAKPDSFDRRQTDPSSPFSFDSLRLHNEQ